LANDLVKKGQAPPILALNNLNCRMALPPI